MAPPFFFHLANKLARCHWLSSMAVKPAVKPAAPKASPKAEPKAAPKAEPKAPPTPPPTPTREEQMLAAAMDCGVPFFQFSPEMTVLEAQKMANEQAQVQVGECLGESSTRAELISSLKDAVYAYGEFLTEWKTRRGLVFSAAEGTYFGQVERDLKFALGKFSMMEDGDLVHLLGDVTDGGGEGDDPSGPTEVPEIQSALKSEPSELKSEPKEVETSRKIFLNQDTKHENKAFDMDYTEPDGGDDRRREKLSNVSLLGENASNDAYLLYRREVRAFLRVAETEGHKEIKVLQQILGSLPPTIKSNVLSHYPFFPEKVTVQKLFTFVDQLFRVSEDVEKKGAISQFKAFSRGANETLTNMLNRFTTSLEKAQDFGYLPDSELAETFLGIANINAVSRTDLISRWNAHEKTLSTTEKEDISRQKLFFYYKYLRDLGTSIDKAQGYKQEKVAVGEAAVGEKSKRTRSRSRTKKQTVNAAAESAEAPAAQTPAALALPAPGAQQPLVLNVNFGGKHKGKFGGGKPSGGSYGGAPLKGLSPPDLNAQASAQQKKGGWKGGKSHGKGKTGKTAQWHTANTQPSPIPPRGWGENAGDWRCKGCNCFNYAKRDQCLHCSAPRPA